MFAIRRADSLLMKLSAGLWLGFAQGSLGYLKAADAILNFTCIFPRVALCKS